jgi:predicted nucleic acid-binding protein
VKLVVSDTSPLNYLILCEAQHVLESLFDQVLIPPAVWREMQDDKSPEPVKQWAKTLPRIVKVQAPTRVDSSLGLDEGEQEAICLALEVKANAVLLDERRGREKAKQLGLTAIGILGVLEAAAIRGLIDFPAIVQRLTQETTARIHPKLVQEALARDAARRRGGRAS